MPQPSRPGPRRGASPTVGGPAQRERSLEELWPQYLRNGYFDTAGTLRPDYVARDRIVPLVKAMDGAQPRLTMSQVRRFFQHCRAIEARLRAHSSTWAAEDPAFRKLDVAAADAAGKSKPKIPRLFHDFIKANVSAVRTERDFLNGFLPHFEALVGFGAQFFRERERS